MNTLIAYAAYDGTGGLVSCSDGITSLTTLINFFTCTLMNAVVPLLMGLAMVGFIYGVIKYFLNPDNEEKRKGGKTFMLWGIITLFVLVSIWALVGLFTNTFLPSGSKTVIPALPEK